MINANILQPLICFWRLGGSTDKPIVFSDITPAAARLFDVTHTHTHTHTHTQTHTHARARGRYFQDDSKLDYVLLYHCHCPLYSIVFLPRETLSLILHFEE
jgi:hypothetical protein